MKSMKSQINKKLNKKLGKKFPELWASSPELWGKDFQTFYTFYGLLPRLDLGAVLKKGKVSVSDVDLYLCAKIAHLMPPRYEHEVKWRLIAEEMIKLTKKKKKQSDSPE